MGNSSDMESMRTFADQLWKYMVPKLNAMFSSNVSYFRAVVVSNPGNNTLEVQRPVESGTLTLPCVRAMSGAQAGQQVVALVMGSMSNAIIVGDGKLNVPGGGGDAGIANFQAQPDGSLVITLTNGNTFTATPVMDDVPTQGSNLAVKSGGIYTALNGKADNAFSNVKVGSTTIVADNKADTLTLVAGDNITLTPNATNDSVTIAATDTTYSSKAAASGGTAISLVTTGEKYTWNNKQNKLTFDTTPTAGSSNPVTSEGIKIALDGKSNTSHTHDNLYYKLTNGTEIPSGADLDDATYRTPGNYACVTNAKAVTIKHFPGYDGTTLVNTKANAFKLFVGYAQGGSNYIAQELRDYYTGAVYYRWWYNSSWRAWRAVRGTASVLISELDTITNNIKDSTLISTSDANGETGIWYRRAATTFWNYIKGKADAVYAAISHTHTTDAVTDLVTATKYGPTGLVSFQDAHGGLPLKSCIVSIEPTQSGSGNPTPANVRPISGWTGAQIHVSPTTIAEDGATYAVEWSDEAGTVYGGTLDVLTGKLTIDKKVVVIKGDASETWSSVNQSISIAIIKTSGIAEGALIASHYTSVTAPVKWGSLGNNQAQFSSDDYIGYKDIANNGTSVATAKAYAQQQYSNGTPITFVGKLKNPVIYQLTPQMVTTLAGANNIWADTGNITVEYGAFLQALQAEIERLNQQTNQRAKKNVLAGVEESTTATTNYAVGDFLIVKDSLYKVTAAIAAGETITVDTNVQETTIAQQLKALFASV